MFSRHKSSFFVATPIARESSDPTTGASSEQAQTQRSREVRRRLGVASGLLFAPRMRSPLPLFLSLCLLLSGLAPVATTGCAAPIGEEGEADAEDLGSIGLKDDSSTSVRDVAVELAPGATKWFRVRATRFHAALAQDGTVPAKLTAKNYDITAESNVSARPELEVEGPDSDVRNWTLKVTNQGTSTLRGTLTITAIEELPETGDVLRETRLTIAAGGVARFRVAGPSIRAQLTQDGDEPAEVSAKHYDLEARSEVAASPFVVAESPDGAVRNWTIRVANLGDATLTGVLTVTLFGEDTDPVVPGERPTLDSPVQYENEWCVYADTVPYVRAVKWDNPDVRAALRAIAPGFRSVFSYADWRVPYGLENERDGTEQERQAKIARNFVRVVCGEHRDYPEMIGAKLRVVGQATHYAGPQGLASVDTSRNLFTQLTYPAYVKLVEVMRAVHAYRQASMAGDRDGYHYGFGAYGHGSRRVDHSVPPWTHCEMKYTFERWLTASAPAIDAATYVTEYETYKTSQCTEQDLAWMYNFRGHVNFQPLWLESNGFMMNSRRARGAEISRGDRSYYLRPFATRHAMARSAWGTYLFYKDEHHGRMIQASESGGGPILYIVDQDRDGNGLQDYRIFDDLGCGDQGVGLPIPSQNCNMVSWEEAWFTPSVTGHAGSWQPSWYSRADMGFMEAFGTFEQRMARLNAALDRHTNWGPTGYYMLDASDEGDQSPRFYGAYSPIVAASYDVSASDFFVRRDYPTTDPFEQGRAKWLHVVKFRADNYYDEEDLRAGRAIDFERHFFNETSLSNDYYRERALDHWGYVPLEEMHAQVYLTYGHRGETAPAPADIPAP